MSSAIKSDDWTPDPDWPITAIPQRWVETLFATMAATYGARFADLWRGTDVAQVKRHWGAELAKITSQQMKAGRENLMALPKPPTLPEFLTLCKQARMEAIASIAPRLENLPRMSPEEATRNLEGVRSAMRKIRLPRPTAEWAYKAYTDGMKRSHKAMRDITDAITSPSGQMTIHECKDAALKAQYAEIRRKVVDDYQARGVPLWGIR